MSSEEALVESIGILGQSQLASTLEASFAGLPYVFTSFEEPSQMDRWLLEKKPALVVVDGAFVTPSADDPAHSRLRQNLSSLGTLSLILSHSSDEIQSWKKSAWPRSHFFLGHLSASMLRRRVTDLLGEWSMADRPLVALGSGKSSLFIRLETLLRNDGFRILSLKGLSMKEKALLLEAEQVSAVILDRDEEANLATEDYAKKLGLPDELLLYWVASEGLENEEEAYSPDEFSVLTGDLQQALHVKAKGSYRHPATGLHSKAIFLKNLQDFWQKMKDQKGTFSLLKICCEDPTSTGPTIADQETRAHLGVFVQNRVRDSDWVAEGSDGTILVCLRHCPADAAKAVMARLREHFSKTMLGSNLSPNLTMALLGSDSVSDFKEVESFCA